MQGNQVAHLISLLISFCSFIQHLFFATFICFWDPDSIKNKTTHNKQTNKDGYLLISCNPFAQQDFETRFCDSQQISQSISTLFLKKLKKSTQSNHINRFKFLYIHFSQTPGVNAAIFCLLHHFVVKLPIQGNPAFSFHMRLFSHLVYFC